MLTVCRKCESEQLVKYGFGNGNQRYKCKKCGHIMNDHPPLGKPQAMKDLAVLLSVMFSASFKSIGRLLGVSDVAVYKWVKKYAESLERPEVSTACNTIIIDEMWHFVNGKKTRFGSGRPMICYQKELLPGRLGNVIIEL
jgi:transposase